MQVKNKSYGSGALAHDNIFLNNNRGTQADLDLPLLDN